MPVTPRPLANAILSPARSIIVPTTAGRSVQFRNGVAVINDTRDLPYLLRRADVKLDISEYAMSWMDEALKETGEVKAQVQWPLPASEPATDSIDEALKDKPRWRKPPSNSSAS